jgi:simple sugar transport system ATP-binding protein
VKLPWPHQSDRPEPLLELQGLTKRFPGVVANDNISLAIFPGQIHTILGENGAGKSTLINILSGLTPPDQGRILVAGRSVKLTSPRVALNLGISTVYQHFTLVPNLSVRENILLGLKRGFWLKDLATWPATPLLAEFGLTMPPQTEVRFLSLGQQQRVELVKALRRGGRVLLLDEPTSVLTPPEVDDLFGLLLRLKTAGVGVVFITHKLDEALQISDQLTILQRGRIVTQIGPAQLAAGERAELSRQIVSLMFGPTSPSIDLVTLKDRLDFDSNLPPICTLHNVSALDDRGALAVQAVNLQLYPGEIVGLAGVDGNGQKELAEVIAGQRPASAGQVWLKEANLTNRGVRAAEQAGLAYITADRLDEGCAPHLNVAQNMILKVIHRRPFSHWLWLNRSAIEVYTQQLIKQFNIKTTGPSARLGTLSGGNIQKLMLARELAWQPKVLVCSQPTQGLDVLTAQSILQILRRQADGGMAVLLISAELDELLAVSDRIGVMYRGQLLALLNRAEANRETIGRLMLRKEQ